MKIVINPAYSHLSEFIERIPEGRYSRDMVFRNNRNTIEKITVENTPLVIKKYKRPTLFNCAVYTFLRKTKAQRSFEYAFRLKDNGVSTAEPVAYIEIKEKGVFHTGYFISEYLDDELLNTIENYDIQTKDKLIEDFSHFTVSLHEKGILHMDYNSSNILFRREGDDFRFSLIDINRIHFGYLTRRKCLKGLKTMGFELPTLVRIAERYAELRGWNPDIFTGALLIKRGMNLPGRIKKKLKSFLGLFKENEVIEEICGVR